MPQPYKPTPQRSAMEKLFTEVAGSDQEVDWMELKRILDHSFREGKPNLLKTHFNMGKICLDFRI